MNENVMKRMRKLLADKNLILYGPKGMDLLSIVVAESEKLYKDHMMDLHIISQDKFGVDDARTLTDILEVYPLGDRHLIILHSNQATPEFYNALLKYVEDGKCCSFVFVTTEPIIGTIESRCIKLIFKNYETDTDNFPYGELLGVSSNYTEDVALALEDNQEELANFLEAFTENGFVQYAAEHGWLKEKNPTYPCIELRKAFHSIAVHLLVRMNRIHDAIALTDIDPVTDKGFEQLVLRNL